MKRLIILRHAKSSWRQPALEDHDRPLSSRGMRDAPLMAQRIIDRNIGPLHVLTSTARRALATAEALAAAEGGDVTLVQNSGIYLAAPGSLLAALATQNDRLETIVLVGHNPGFTQLANRLLPDLRLSNLPTAGVVSILFPCDSWADIEAARGTLEFLDYPKKS